MFGALRVNELDVWIQFYGQTADLLYKCAWLVSSQSTRLFFRVSFHCTELQIKGGGGGGEGVLRISQGSFSYFSTKTCCDPSLEPSRRDCSNDGLQICFMEKYG